MAYRVVVRPSGKVIVAEAGQTILEAALAAGIDWPYGCAHGMCGTCKARLLVGQVDLGDTSSFALFDDERAEGFILTCSARPTTDLELTLGDEAHALTHDKVNHETGREIIHRITIQGSDVGFFCSGDDSILRAGLRAGYGLSYECNVGSCGSCKFMLVSGEVKVLWLEAPGQTQRDRDREVKLACQSQPLSDCVIKATIGEEYAPRILPHRFIARFVEAREVTHDMQEFVFDGVKSAEFVPGQYCLFRFEGIAGLRAYSMSNIANLDGQWTFVVRRVPNGTATGWLFDRLKPGDEIELDGPYGLAYLRTGSPRDVVCIAGGAGLSPMLSIARGMARERSLNGRHLRFFFGGREPRDICGEAILSTIPELENRMSYFASISASEGDLDGEWTGERGFIHDLVAKQLAEDFKSYEYYLAGPPPMIQAVLKLLMFDQRVPREQIHYDRLF